LGQAEEVEEAFLQKKVMWRVGEKNRGTPREKGENPRKAGARDTDMSRTKPGRKTPTKRGKNTTFRAKGQKPVM